jgi:predicted metallo-beta-lactamase superfamily hydrolase
MSREEIWVLCRATRFNEIIVITKRDYDHWTSYLVTHYEFIAQGRRREMERFQQLAKGR